MGGNIEIWFCLLHLLESLPGCEGGGHHSSYPAYSVKINIINILIVNKESFSNYEPREFISILEPVVTKNSRPEGRSPTGSCSGRKLIKNLEQIDTFSCSHEL